MPAGALWARPVLAGAVVAAGALVGGCASPPSPAASSSPPVSSAVPASSASSTSSSSSSTTTTTTTASGTTARCQPSALVAFVSGSQGAAGTVELTVQLRSTATVDCTLEGYPGAQLVGTDGTELPTDVVRGGSYAFTDFPSTSTTLAPGTSAYFNVAYSDVPGASGSCASAASLWVTPPDDVDHVVVSRQLTVCDGGALTVSPIFGAGSRQTQTTAPAQ